MFLLLQGTLTRFTPTQAVLRLAAPIPAYLVIQGIYKISWNLVIQGIYKIYGAKHQHPFSAATAGGLNRAPQAVAPERRAVLLGLGLGADDHHREPIHVRLLHDVHRIVHSHPRDHFHQDLDDVLAPVVVVVVQDDAVWGRHLALFPADQNNLVITCFQVCNQV